MRSVTAVLLGGTLVLVGATLATLNSNAGTIIYRPAQETGIVVDEYYTRLGYLGTIMPHEIVVETAERERCSVQDEHQGHFSVGEAVIVNFDRAFYVTTDSNGTVHERFIEIANCRLLKKE